MTTVLAQLAGCVGYEHARHEGDLEMPGPSALLNPGRVLGETRS
jgi:hypothetical protein